MKKLVMLLVISLIGIAVSSASTLQPGQLATQAEHALIEKAQTCNPGSYYCPGQVAGCCPNGWGCGSTSCIPPGAAPPAPSNACPAGSYWCPGKVSGCCPNGWSCGDTTCTKRR